MSVERLTRPFPPYASRAAAALALAQELADASADLEGLARRKVPDLGPAVVGDQVAVTGEDLAAAGDALAEPHESVTHCLGALTALRRAL
jgi:hypothetical protein